MTIQTRQGILSILLLSAITTRPALGQSPFRGISFPELIEPFITRTYDPENPSETCYDTLYTSDNNGDGILQNYEYTAFVAGLSEGDFNETSYIDLPFALKVNFVYLSCLCRFFPDSSGSRCCEGPEGGIDVTGADPNGGIALGGEGANYLQTVCSETQGAIEFARDEAGLSASPTGAPTAEPTLELSAGPTESPTDPPSEEPTPSPSDGPTESPMDPPSKSPSERPTQSPTTSAPSTAAPTGGPTPTPVTDFPTERPTQDPVTDGPTPAPSTAQPTRSPTRVTAIPTTPIPLSDEPTESPSTKAPISGTGAPTVSPSTKAPISGTGAPTESPSTKAPISGTGAPTEAPSIAVVTVPTTTKPTFAQVPAVPTTKAPTPGGTAYPTVSSQPSAVKSATFPTDPPPPSGLKPETVENPSSPREPESESLTAGQVVGIALAAAFVGIAAAYVYATRQKRKRDDDPELAEVKNQDLDDLEAGQAVETMGDDDQNRKSGGGSSGSDGSERRFSTGERSDHGSDEGSDEAVYVGEPYDNPDYIPQSSSPSSGHDTLVTGMPISPPKRTKESDSSSAASESGWSSSAGMSSLNTASFDDRTDDGLLPGTPDRLLEAIGVADTVTQSANSTQRDAKPSFIPVNDQNSSSASSSYESTQGSSDNAMGGSTPLKIHSDRPQHGKVSREDLNAAIEAGDWAMVGATAALLADSTETSLSGSEVQSVYGSAGRSIVSASSDSNNRTSELDQMVVSGDWLGVVLAAAQFEGTGHRDEDTMGSESMGMRTEGSRNKEEVRAEVEQLVRRVVPDEVENIDEMMLQFEGREEELIETLRTMQERNTAQRARLAVQKTAKLEARAKASIASSASTTSMGNYALRDTNSRSMSSEPSHYGSSTNSSVSSYTEHSANSSVSDLEMSSSRKTTQSSLELAIERGDWRAVGEAAAMMGGSSGIIPDSPGDSISSGLSESVGKSERVYYLDALIAKGDWAGIVATAGKYQAMDDQTKPGPPTEEEREALAQANMWQTIANQSRQDSGAEAKGALDAADWAISRSLEQKMKSTDGADTSGRDPVPKMPRITDDESV